MTTLQIKGMKCGHCSGSVKKALEQLEGITDVEVDLEQSTATFNGSADIDQVKAAIEAAGFSVAG